MLKNKMYSNNIHKMPKKMPKRRRLQPTPAIIAGTLAVAKAVKKGYDKRKKAYATKVELKAKQARGTRMSRIQESDNITTLTPVRIGTPRTISFQEKVSRTIREPLIFKRNYGFSAESVSGRKGWFAMEVNRMTNVDLQLDITNYKGEYFTSTVTQDTNVPGVAPTDNARFYVDYHSEKIQMVNSSSNGLTGKIHLYSHKRDNENAYSTDLVPVSPINLMMYYSTASTNTSALPGAGLEGVAGNGWAFNAVAGNVNYLGNYNMPGSSINASGFTASTDPELNPHFATVKDRMDYWFTKVSTKEFSLKPGQQINSSFIFNDLPKIFREEQIQYVNLAGITYHIVVEFKAGIVGDNTSVSGDGKVSIGNSQLSVIRESKRIIGLETTLKAKVYLQTAPLDTIALANQVVINQDTGVAQVGTVQDV